MGTPVSSQEGFTLIEVIASLIIMGCIGAIAGMGIVHVVDGYVLAKQSSEAVQKSRIAITRLTKEFQSLTEIADSPGPSSAGLMYFRDDRIHSLVYTPETGEIWIDNGLLLDEVNFFSLTYHDQYDDPKPNPSDPLSGFSEDTQLVDIFLKVNGPGSATYQFETRVFLRGRVEGR